MACNAQNGGGRKRKQRGGNDESLVLTGGNLKGGVFLGGSAAEFPGAYGAEQVGGTLITPGQGGGRRSRRMIRRKGRAGKSRTRSTCSGGSKKRKSRKSGGSKKRGGKSRKH